MSSFHFIKYIFLNRYRKLTYKDSGPFYFFSFLYFLSLYQLYFWENPYSNKVILLMFFLQNISFLYRKDFSFLKKTIGVKKALFIVIIDLCLLSLFFLIITFFKSLFFLIIELLFIILIPFVLLLKKINTSSIHFFSSKDPLWINYIREKPWGLILLLIVYYIQFQALLIQNKGLFHVATCGSLLFVLNVYTENEHFFYLKISSKDIKKHLLYLLFINIKNTFYILVPSVLLITFYGIENFQSILIILSAVSLLFWMRYYFLKNNLSKNFFGLILTIVIAGFYNQEDKLAFFFLVGIMNVIFFKIIINKFVNFSNTKNQ